MDELTPLFNTEDDLFYFESDHLALKGNQDYCDVLKTLVILSAQRERMLKDYKTVSALKKEALEDPFGSLEKIQNGSDLGVPPICELPKLPVIDFHKYSVKVPESELSEIYSDAVQKTEEKPQLKKPNTNRGWTPDEQKRLEELLHIYPPEPVEMKRFQKIAKALGNRTVHQVASRVQKYFLKLYKAGLPIPGRIPKSGEKYKKSALHKHQRHNHYLWKPTTFFPELSVPVQMDDLDNIPGPSNVSSPDPSSNTNPSENYLLRTEYHQNSEPTDTSDTEHELELKLLKRLREIKTKEVGEDYVAFSHIGYKCDYCEQDPITGSRWHCIVCPDSIDFCTDCVISQMYSENPHPVRHWLAVYEDNFENRLLPDVFSQPAQFFDKQISDELKGEGLEVNSDSEDSLQ